MKIVYRQAFVAADHQMTASGIIRELWHQESEQIKSVWTKIAQLYSEKRNENSCSQYDLRLYLGSIVKTFGITPTGEL